MKSINIIHIFLTVLTITAIVTGAGCASKGSYSSVKSQDVGLTETTREEYSDYMGRREITEYSRNSTLILTVERFFRKDSGEVWHVEQNVHYNGDIVLTISDMKLEKDKEKYYAFAGTKELDVTVLVSFCHGRCEYVAI